jgi:OFA family oxalate/formate antiporter-like MFS transporter
LESKRWRIAIAAVLIQLCLGTVYAWSVFKKPLMAGHGWGEMATQVTFMLNIGFLGLAAAFAGGLLEKKGPRFVAILGGVLFGLGTLLAGVADRIGNIYLLWLGFGVIAGVGNGFGYITPISTLVKWFPDKRGLVTGLAVMGFGAGAFFMGQIAPLMIAAFGIAKTWYVWGGLFLVLIPAAALLYESPPPGWVPAGFKPASLKNTQSAASYSFSEAIRKPQWWMLWSMLFLNITAGIGLISQLSPMAQEILEGAIPDGAMLAAAAGTIVAVSSLFNGLGRLIWSWLSDAIGRKTVFLILFASEIGLYLILPRVGSSLLFTAIASYLLSTYGGGFSTMPAFVSDAFGPANVGKIYGTMLTAWSAAAIAGPFIFARWKGSALLIAAFFLFIGLAIAAVFRKPAGKNA